MKKSLLNEKREKSSVIMIVLMVILIIYCISMLFPMLWALMTSFKSRQEVRLNVIGLPKQFEWNYSYVLNFFSIKPDSESQEISFIQMFANSFLYAFGCALAYSFVSCMTAYLCARFKFKFGKVIYWIVVVTMILPIVGNLPSEIQVAKALGLYDNMAGAWFMKANFLGMNFLVFYGLYKSIPWAYTEAAQIDGASNLDIFFKIIFPLSASTFATIMLISFITFWNDYQTPLIYLKHYPTAMTGLYQIAFTYENTMNYINIKMTAVMLVFIPVFIIFIIFQKRLMGNMTVGGIKG